MAPVGVSSAQNAVLALLAYSRKPSYLGIVLFHTQTPGCSGLAPVPGRHDSLLCSLCYLDNLEWCLWLDSRLDGLHSSCHQSQSHCHLFLGHYRHFHGETLSIVPVTEDSEHRS